MLSLGSSVQDGLQRPGFCFGENGENDEDEEEQEEEGGEGKRGRRASRAASSVLLTSTQPVRSSLGCSQWLKHDERRPGDVFA